MRHISKFLSNKENSLRPEIAILAGVGWSQLELDSGGHISNPDFSHQVVAKRKKTGLTRGLNGRARLAHGSECFWLHQSRRL